MMNVKHKLQMDLAGQALMPRADVVEQDQYARQLELELLCGGESWEIPADAGVLIVFQKEDGTGGEYDTLPNGDAAWSASGNRLTVELAPQVLTCPGLVTLFVELLQGNARITTFSILLQVHKSAAKGLESEGYVRCDGFLPQPTGAEVGQFFRVAAVNEHGGASRVEAVTLPSLEDALAQARDSGEFQGDTAYEIAVKNGFSGTEAEWLASLKGENGTFDTKLGDIQQINVTGKLSTDMDIIIDFHGSRVRGVTNPVLDTDAANKGYVDRAAAEYVVPSYWSSDVEAAAAKIRANQDAGGRAAFSFALLGDLHAVPGSTTPNAGNAGHLAAAVMAQCRIPFALCCGDAGRMDADTETAARESLAAAEEILAPIGTARLFQAQGEYDGYYGTAQLSQNALYGELFRAQAADARRCIGGDGSYFYVDDSTVKVRYIVLNSCWTDDSILRTASFGYGNTQLNWLAQTALTLPESGWGVILTAHVPPISAFSTSTRDVSQLVGILTAFQNHGAYTGTCGTDGAWDYVSVSCDFSGKPEGELIGFFAGHSHADSIVTGDAPCTVVTVASDAILADGRTAGTVTEHVVDFVTVNRWTKTVSLTRLGAGADRSYSYT